MSGQRLLYLNTHRLSAYAWQAGRLALEDVFENTADDQARFADYLSGHGDEPFRLLANVAEESHQVETIPFLQGKDRQTLIERKISQLFFGATLATAVPLGYEKNRRKNERLLLSALTNPAHFQPWLNALAVAEIPLAGLYTISQLGGQFLRKLTKLPERCLLVTQQDHSLRESFVVNGIPLFSRMAPLSDSSIAGTAAAMAAEASKLHQYLVGQRQIGRNDTLPVFVLAHAGAREAMEAACIDTAGLNFAILDNGEASRRLGLKTPPDNNCCELLFLHLLAIAPPRQQYISAELRHDHQLHRAKRWLLGGGVIVMLAGAAFAATQFLAARSLHQESQELRDGEKLLARRYQEISATFPQLGVSNEVLRRIAGRYQEIVAVRRDPGAAFRLVSNALSESPAIELEALEWRLASTTDVNAPPSTSGHAGILGASHEIIVIRGKLTLPASTQPRQVLAAVEQFTRRLQTDPGLRVTVLQQPFDTESGRNLKGGNQEDENPQPRTFALQVARKLTP